MRDKKLENIEVETFEVFVEKLQIFDKFCLKLKLKVQIGSFKKVLSENSLNSDYFD